MVSPRKYLAQGTHQYPHIGDLVRKRMELQHLTIAEMARRLNVADTGFAAYLKRPSIQYGILWKIGLAMEYNFFGDIAMQFPVEYTDKNAGAMQAFIKEKDERIKDLEKEISIYKDIISGFRK